MAVCLYINATDDIKQAVAGVSTELATNVRALHEQISTDLQHPLQATTAAETLRQLGPRAEIYASLLAGNGLKTFFGRRLVRNPDSGNESNPLTIIQLLNEQKQWADTCGDDAYAQAYLGAIKQAGSFALRGQLTVFWGDEIFHGSLHLDNR